jgi:hypothetical protein
MAAKFHAEGRYWTYSERVVYGINNYRDHETLCGLHFKKSDRDPFAPTLEDVTCQWCQKIINKQETQSL